MSRTLHGGEFILFFFNGDIVGEKNLPIFQKSSNNEVAERISRVDWGVGVAFSKIFENTIFKSRTCIGMF